MTERELETRLEALLTAMTLEEKVAQMVIVPCNMVTMDEAREWARRGAAGFLHVWGDEARELQSIARETRLGLPALIGIDAVHGHCINDHGTVFPSPLASACIWDREILRAMARATALEMAGDGVHWTFSPVLCLARDTRWGRVDETFGEDPYLAGELGAAMVDGYQNGDISAPGSVLACAKHYAAYGESVGGRDSCDAEITFRKAREVFLPPFEKAVKAGCATFMTAYGSFDGTPCTLNGKLLKDVLRGEMGFDGFVVTDWDNVQHLVDEQRVCANLNEASAKAARAGNDMIMTTLDFYDAALRMINSGELEEGVIDEAVRHILTVKLRMGLFDDAQNEEKPERMGCAEHRELSADMARESLVLLRNDGMLPLRARSVAVIGAGAEDLPVQYGDWTYFTHPMHNLDRAGVRPYATVREGMEAQAEGRAVKVAYARGCGILPSPQDDELMREAMEAARDSEAIVMVVSDCYELFGEWKDRADLALSGRQAELYDMLRGLDRPICVVLVASKPLCLGRMAEDANALIIAFNGGMYGGQAVAEAIFGAINPCGKLPISFPRHSGQLPVYYNFLPGWHGDKYADLSEGPQFAFGEGISYTDFALEGIRFDQETLLASLMVRNTGARDGATVVQVYFRDVVSSIMTPVKQLTAFERVTLKAGEAKEVAFQMKREDFSLVTPDERRVTEPGDFVLMIGTSSRDEDLTFIPFSLR